MVERACGFLQDTQLRVCSHLSSPLSSKPAEALRPWKVALLQLPPGFQLFLPLGHPCTSTRFWSPYSPLRNLPVTSDTNTKQY